MISMKSKWAAENIKTQPLVDPKKSHWLDIISMLEEDFNIIHPEVTSWPFIIQLDAHYRDEFNMQKLVVTDTGIHALMQMHMIIFHLWMRAQESEREKMCEA